MRGISGFINVLKPIGLTSHQVVAEVRKLTPYRTKVGHTGTLDPAATGVLVLCLGAATRLAECISSLEKVYRAEFTFGVRTDTHDVQGRVVAIQGAAELREDQVREKMSQFCGLVAQKPPVFSAVCTHGERSYRLARRGEMVDLPPRLVRIDRFELIRFTPGRFATGLFEICCSSGTYVRSLCRDLGEALGCGAFVSFLVRVRVGKFHVNEAVPLEDLERSAGNGRLHEYVVNVADALDHLPVVVVSGPDARRVQNGASPAMTVELPEGAQVLLSRDCSGVFALGVVRGKRIKVEKVLGD